MPISSQFDWISLLFLALGGLFNGFEAWLIVRHSPGEMRVYSQILLQICAVDALTLILGPIIQQVN